MSWLAHEPAIKFRLNCACCCCSMLQTLAQKIYVPSRPCICKNFTKFAQLSLQRAAYIILFRLEAVAKTIGAAAQMHNLPREDLHIIFPLRATM